MRCPNGHGRRGGVGDGAGRGACDVRARAQWGRAVRTVHPRYPTGSKKESAASRNGPRATGLRPGFWGTLNGVAADMPGNPTGLRRVARALGRPPAAVARRIRRATHAEGAGESGLGKLIELHAVNSAGDMLITVALASTVFFSVPTGEARGRVALYLAVTMAPSRSSPP